MNHDGGISSDKVKTEWYPEYGQEENLGNYGKEYKHMYAECSNAGVCNRETGECECFTGFEGSSCQRTSCPKTAEGLCSSHGVCVPGYKDASNGKNKWELHKFYKCRCDRGYTGYDCSERDCQNGVDPLSITKMYMNYQFSLPHNHTDPNGRMLSTTPSKMVPFFFDVEFNDVKYISPYISSRALDDVCRGSETTVFNKTIALNFQEEIRRALQTLPPISQSSVLLSCNQEKLPTIAPSNAPHEDDNINKVLVTISIEYTDYDAFKNSHLYIHEMYEGKKSTDNFDGDVIATNPYHNSTFVTSIDGSDTYVEEVITEALKEYPVGAKQTVCSGRGKCNKQTGLCECFYGFYGSACNMQLKLAV